MDFRVAETDFLTCEKVVDAVSEQPIDGDFILPEYCPDVASVLKCQVAAVVQTRQLSGDRLTVEGTVGLRVLYLDEERHCVRVCEFSQPFCTVFSLPLLSPKAFFYLHTDTDYVNCRAVSPRRLDIHGAFTVSLKVMDTVERKLITAAEGEGVYARHVQMNGTVPAAFQEKPFSVNEVLELNGDHHASTAMLHTSVVPQIHECKVLTNKAIVKGILYVGALYITDAVSGAVEEAAAEIPFSQILDMEGLNEEWLCDADVVVTAADVCVEASQGGENVRLAVNAKLQCALYGWRNENVQAVCDAYSAHYPLSMEQHTVPCMQLHVVCREEHTVQQRFEVPGEDTQTVLGAWCRVLSCGMSGDGDLLKLEGRLLWCLLTQDSRGEVSYYERTEPFCLTYTDNCRDDTPGVAVSRTACRLMGGRVELSATLAVTRRACRASSHCVPCSIVADESAPYPQDTAALKIVYAAKGESLWEIARRSRTGVEAIMEENRLSEDILAADTMLLIPLC